MDKNKMLVSPDGTECFTMEEIKALVPIIDIKSTNVVCQQECPNYEECEIYQYANKVWEELKAKEN